MIEPAVCIISNDIRWQTKFNAAFANSAALHFVENYQNAIPIIKDQLIGCIIVPTHVTSPEKLKPLTAFRNHFSHIPLIIYGKVADEQLCFELGKIGIEAYFETDMMKELVAKVQGIIEQRKFKIDFSQFGIDVERCPITIMRALKIIEKQFLSIKTVTEIAERLNISLNHLEREFTRSCNISCKKLLIGLRLFYATYLMESKKQRSLNKIAIASGFNNDKSFCRCFSKSIGVTARIYRENYLSKDFPAIFMKNINKRKK